MRPHYQHEFYEMIAEYRLTVGSTLRNRSFASAASHTNAIDHIALLSLVPKTTSFIWTRRTGSAMDHIELTELYYALSAKFNECIARHFKSATILAKPSEMVTLREG